jgi:hypothetical protein
MKVTRRRVRITNVIVEKAKSITYSECVSVALVIQHAKGMQNAFSSPLAAILQLVSLPPSGCIMK